MNNNKPTVILLSGNSGCVDCDTEFFNGMKWKKISEYNDEDFVLQYNSDGTANLVKPINYIKQNADFLYEFNNTRLSMCLSENHECYYITSKNNLYHKTFKEIMDSHINSKSGGFSGRFITSFKYSGNGINLSDNEIKLMCAVICDSSFIKDSDICFLNLKKKRKQNELRNILKSLNYNYKEFEFPSMPGYIRFKFKAPRKEKEFSDFWYGCNNHQLQVICDNIYKWDGSYNQKNDSITFSTTNINTANFIQFAYSACGYRASICIRDRVGREYTTNNKLYKRVSVEYSLNISRHNLVRMANRHIDDKKSMFKKYKTIDGYEYCFTVPSHMLVLRRNNKIFITGNCGKDYVANIMKQQLEKDNKKVLITHYADLLKYVLKTFMNWDGNKDEKGRSLLQKVGTDIVRKQNPNYWVQFVIDMITMLPVKWDYILIPDARFLNEIELIKQNPNFETYTVKVDRKNIKSNLTIEQKEHSSETSLKDYSFDYIIYNDVEVDNNISIFLKDINKKIAFIDLDGVVLDTISCIVNLYNEDFQYYPNFKKINPEDISTWEFKELACATPEQINAYFNQPRFFEKVREFNYAYNVIYDLAKRYKIIFVSHGYEPNLKLKEIYIKKRFPYADFIGVDLNKYNDKSCVNMSGEGNVFIDDKSENLDSSNADIKICFGKTYPWNCDYKADPSNNKYDAHNWLDVAGILS